MEVKLNFAKCGQYADTDSISIVYTETISIGIQGTELISFGVPAAETVSFGGLVPILLTSVDDAPLIAVSVGAV